MNIINGTIVNVSSLIENVEQECAGNYTRVQANLQQTVGKLENKAGNITGQIQYRGLPITNRRFIRRILFGPIDTVLFLTTFDNQNM